MAVFRLDSNDPCAAHPDNVARVDWLLLQNGPVSLYHSRQLLQEDVAVLQSYGYRCPAFECASWDSELAMHRAVAAELAFPDYYGENLDALNECMSCLDIPEAGGLALVLWGFDKFLHQFPRAWHVLDIIAHASWGHLLFGRRLLGLVQSDDPSLAVEPVGAKGVTWNPREWFDKDRGLTG